MITTTEVGDIIYNDCKALGLPVYRFGNIPKGELKSERIVVYVKSLTPDEIWESVFVNVNLCVPDKQGKALLERLGELERTARKELRGKTSMYDSTRYAYSISSSGIEEDTALKCHFVNIRLKFDILNVI